MDLRGLRLGAFLLDAPIARGGMGEVWHAVHVTTGAPAAVKIVADASPRMTPYLQAEIRAAAALDHPAIVKLYDAGELAAPSHELPAGTPWLAMELLTGGTLTERRVGWAEAKQVLGDLLRALGHAHAAGVLHRDVKPDNVLFDAAGGTRLVDFGVGVRLDEDGRSVKPSGTPQWMAPEQFESAAHQLGPWTDLYGVGCVAFWMASGSPPFAGDTAADLRRAHTESPPPNLVPEFAVPPRFVEWIGKLLAKHPRDRFRRASDAVQALEELGEPVTIGRRRAARSRTTMVPSDGALPPDPLHRGPWLPGAAAGLGLVRLRDAPLRGRDREQAALTRALERASAGVPRLVVLSGPSGSGKTRLATWFGKEVHESGRGTPFRASHAATHGDGLRGLLSRALRLHGGEDAAEVRARIEAAGVPAPLAVAELVRPSPVGGVAMDLAKRCSVAADALRVLAEGRLPVVWCDDAQWAPELCALAQHVAGRAEGWLVMLAVRTDAEPNPEAVAILASLEANRLALGSLRLDHALALVGDMAGLDGPTRRALVRHTGGSPLFLVELVGEWIGRGLLVPGPDGFTLVRDAAEAWPADRAALWRSRLVRVLAADAERMLPVLAVAAALGAEVDADELARACGPRAGVDAVVRRLLAERLAVPDPSFQVRRWSFVHGSLREAVLGLAAERGLLADAHRACAEMLAAGGAHAQARRATHLEAAGDFAGAVDALLIARAWFIRRDLGDATAVADRAERLLVHLPGDDRRRGDVAIARARIAVFRGDRAEAMRWAEIALASPDRRTRALGLAERGRLRRLADRIPEALADYRPAIAELRIVGDREQLAVTLAELSLALRDAGELDEGDAAVVEGIALTADPVRRAELETLRVSPYILNGRFEEAITMLDRLEPAMAGPENVFPRAMWHYHRAFARASLGAWVGAEADAGEAVRLRYEMGGRSGGWLSIWAESLIMLERPDEAESVLQYRATKSESPTLGLVAALLAATRGRWDAAADALATFSTAGADTLSCKRMLLRVIDLAEDADSDIVADGVADAARRALAAIQPGAKPRSS